MPAGEYVYPFTFTFPGDQQFPPTFKRRLGCVRYVVESKIHRPGLKPCNTKRVPIIFVPKLDVNDPEYEQPVIVSESKVLSSLSTSSGPINATMTVPRKAWAPGDRFEIKLDIFNNSSKVLDGFAIALRTHYTFLSGHNKTIREKPTEDIPIETFSEQIMPMCTLFKKISVTIPSVEQAFTIEVGKAIERTYSIAVIVKVPGFHFNLTLLAPVVIGTIPYNKALQNTPFYTPSAPPLLSSALVPDEENEPSAPLEDGEPVQDYLSMLYSQLNGYASPDPNPVDANPNGVSATGSTSTIPSWSTNPPPPTSTSSSFAVDSNRAASAFAFSMIGDENADDNDADLNEWVIVK